MRLLAALLATFFVVSAPALADEGLRPVNPQPSVPSPPGALAPEPFATKITQRVDLTDFDPRGCDGAHDIAPAFNALDSALNSSAYVQSYNGAASVLVNVPPGQCYVGSQINITHPMAIRGAGDGIGPGGATSGGGTYFVTGSYANGDIFYVNTPYGRGVTFEDIAFNAGAQRTGGAAIHITGVANSYTNSGSGTRHVAFLNQYNDVLCEGCAPFYSLARSYHTSWAHDAIRLQPLPGLETAAVIESNEFIGATGNCNTTQEAGIVALGGYLRVMNSGFLGSQFHIYTQPGLTRSATLIFQGNSSEEAQNSNIYAQFGGLPWTLFSISDNEFSAINSAGCAGYQSHVTIADAGQVFTATTTSGSNQLTNISGTSPYQGEPISGAGIPAGTTVTSGDGVTPATMSANATASASNVAITHNGPWLNTVDISHNIINSYLRSPAAAFVVAGAQNGGIEANKMNNNGQSGLFASMYGHVGAPFRVADNSLTGFSAANPYNIGTINRVVTLLSHTGLPFSDLAGLTGAADGSQLFVTGATAPSSSSFAAAVQSGSANANACLLNGAWVNC